MNNETKLLLKLQYDFNNHIIKNKLVGYGNSEIENKLIDRISISEKLDLAKPFDKFLQALHNLDSVSDKK